MPESASPASSLSCLCLPARFHERRPPDLFLPTESPARLCPAACPPLSRSPLSEAAARPGSPAPCPRLLFPRSPNLPLRGRALLLCGSTAAPSPLTSPASRTQPLLATAPTDAAQPSSPACRSGDSPPSCRTLPFPLPSAWCRCRLCLPHGAKRIKKQEPSVMLPHHERPLLHPYSGLRKASFPPQRRSDKTLSNPCKVYQECHVD